MKISIIGVNSHSKQFWKLDKELRHVLKPNVYMVSPIGIITKKGLRFDRMTSVDIN